MVLFATATELLDEAASHIGYVEGPNNQTKFGEWIGMPGGYGPWCAAWVSFVGARVGAQHYPRTPSTVEMAEWFISKDRWTTRPRRGLIGFADWDGDLTVPHIDHCYVIEKVRADGFLQTIEANTSDGVYRRLRSPARFVGAGDWLDEPVLALGETGREVKRLQAALGIVPDGIFGPRTLAAVTTFQRRHDLAPDGICGPRTWEVLTR